MFAKVALKGKTLFKSLIQTKGQRLSSDPFLCWWRALGLKNLEWKRTVVFPMGRNFPDLQSCPRPAL